MRRTATTLAAVVAVLAGLLAPTTAWADEADSTATGADVSYPQCGGRLPDRGAIAVVGVNAGIGTTTNPCLSAQLAWADAAGAPGDVYVNTANPGRLGGWWPGADLTRVGLPVTNPRGRCVGAEDAACAYVYGYSIAWDDVFTRGVTRAGERTWWLDVETMNSWSWDRDANRAVLEGMTALLHQVGAGVGVYSTRRQFSLIAGGADAVGLTGTASWVAGATTRAGALANCAAGGLLPAGRAAMAQWVEAGLDHDVSCTPGVTGGVPVVTGDPVVGGLLQVAVPDWSSAALTVQWYRDGVPLPGATASALTVTAAEAGARLTARVTGSVDGAPPLVRSSAAIAIAAEPPASPAPSATPTASASGSPAR